MRTFIVEYVLKSEGRKRVDTLHRTLVNGRNEDCARANFLKMCGGRRLVSFALEDAQLELPAFGENFPVG